MVEFVCNLLDEPCRRVINGYKDCIGCFIFHRIIRHQDSPDLYKKVVKNE